MAAKSLAQDDMILMISGAIFDHYNKNHPDRAIETIEDIPGVGDWLPGLVNGLVEVLEEQDRLARDYYRRVAYSSGGRGVY